MGECGSDLSGCDMVVGHLAGCWLQCASLPGSTVCTSSRGSGGRLRDSGAAQCEGHRAPADQVAALCWAVVLYRRWPPYRLLVLLAGREVVGIVGKLYQVLLNSIGFIMLPSATSGSGYRNG